MEGKRREEKGREGRRREEKRREGKGTEGKERKGNRRVSTVKIRKDR